MSRSLAPSLDPVFLAYVAVFAAAAVACFATVRATRRIEDPDTRRGFAALLLASGTWASTHVGFLLAPSVSVAVAFYIAGTVVGLAAIGPWLYFCSAYTGRTIHRNRAYQRVLAGAFLVVVAVKVTNPVHHQYFQTTIVTTPFPHLAIQYGLVHWVVTGLSYGLAMVGYFMLFERFTQINYDTRPLLALFAVTGLPIALDVVGFGTPYLIDITYEPIGVAVFAVVAMFVYLSRFEAVQVTGSHDEPTILLDDHDRIREYNDSAAELFPALGDGAGLGEPLWSAVPTLADAAAADSPVFELERSERTRYYRLTETPFAADQGQLGRLLIVDDVTDREQYRRELERQNDRLEQFASMVSHDLRNPLNVAMARIELARDEREDENLDIAADALDRMEVLIDDVLTLAHQGQPIDDTETVSLVPLAEASWEMVDTSRATLDVESDCSFEADPDRLRQLLENLFRNSVEHGTTGSGPVSIRVGGLAHGFYVEDDGPGIPEDERADVFESGYTTDESGTGFGLAIVAEIVDAHGWTIEITDGPDGGARFEITGVESVVCPPSAD